MALPGPAAHFSNSLPPRVLGASWHPHSRAHHLSHRLQPLLRTHLPKVRLTSGTCRRRQPATLPLCCSIHGPHCLTSHFACQDALYEYITASQYHDNRPCTVATAVAAPPSACHRPSNAMLRRKPPAELCLRTHGHSHRAGLRAEGRSHTTPCLITCTTQRAATSCPLPVNPPGAGVHVAVQSAWAGLAAGVLHTLCGPDHLAALTPLTIGRSRAAASTLGALWGFGHSTGQLILGLVFILLKVRGNGRCTLCTCIKAPLSAAVACCTCCWSVSVPDNYASKSQRCLLNDGLPHPKRWACVGNACTSCITACIPASLASNRLPKHKHATITPCVRDAQSHVPHANQKPHPGTRSASATSLPALGAPSLCKRLPCRPCRCHMHSCMYNAQPSY